VSSGGHVNKPEYDGVKVKLAGKEYVVPPLSFKGWQTHEALIRDFWKVRAEVLAAKERGDESALIDAPFIVKYLPIAHSAIKRNYPDVTLVYLEDNLTLVDIDAFQNAIVAAMNDGEEKRAPGEVLAVAS
jgi:hypothetical protein